MAFVANARPEAPKRLRQGESFDPASRGKSDTHACSLNKGIGCKSRTRKESVAGSAVCTVEIANTRQGSESSCDSKVLFSMRGIPACGENRSLEGLSWPGEKAEAMRLREKEDAVSETARLHAHEWISQKTYKKQNRRYTSTTAGSCDVKKLSKDLHSENLSQKR